MARPIYETKADRSRERQVAERLGRLARMQAHPMPLRYKVDWALIDRHDRVRMWLEIKCRTNAMRRYPTYMLSIGKYLDMVHLQQSSNLPVRLAVQWTDHLGVLEVPAPHEIRIGGRSDRNDWQDQEPVALFDVSFFNVIAPDIPLADGS